MFFRKNRDSDEKSDEFVEDIEKIEIDEGSEQKIDEIATTKTSRNFHLFTIFLVGIFLSLSIYTLIESYRYFLDIYAYSKVLSYLFAGGILLVFLSSIFFAFSQIYQYTSFKNSDRIKEEIKNSSNNLSKYREMALRICDIYAKNRAIECDIENLREEIRNHEIERIDEEIQKLLAPLDRLANKVILSEGLKITVLTSASRNHLLDLLLILFRSISLTKKVASIYGYRGGFTSNIMLFKKVSLAMLFASASEIGIDTLGGTLATRISTSLMQGSANGLVMLKIGLNIKKSCRPWKIAKSSNLVQKFFKKLTTKERVEG